MFFRRERPKTHSFTERVDQLRAAGFTVATRSGGTVRISRNGIALDLKDVSGQPEPVAAAGVIIGDEIGTLVDGGYQKFFRTPTGKKKPALADELKALHDFEEDVRESLGRKSLYNEALGTVSNFYLYDRVQDRDKGVPKRVWE